MPPEKSSPAASVGHLTTSTNASAGLRDIGPFESSFSLEQHFAPYRANLPPIPGYEPPTLPSFASRGAAGPPLLPPCSCPARQYLMFPAAPCTTSRPRVANAVSATLLATSSDVREPSTTGTARTASAILLPSPPLMEPHQSNATEQPTSARGVPPPCLVTAPAVVPLGHDSDLPPSLPLSPSSSPCSHDAAENIVSNEAMASEARTSDGHTGERGELLTEPRPLARQPTDSAANAATKPFDELPSVADKELPPPQQPEQTRPVQPLAQQEHSPVTRDVSSDDSRKARLLRRFAEDAGKERETPTKMGEGDALVAEDVVHLPPHSP